MSLYREEVNRDFIYVVVITCMRKKKLQKKHTIFLIIFYMKSRKLLIGLRRKPFISAYSSFLFALFEEFLIET